MYIFTRLLAAVLLVWVPYWGFAQTTLFTETMGTVSSTTTIASHEGANGFDNDSYTMSAGGITNPADIRNSDASTGQYTGASGGANVWFTTTSGAYGFEISGINASSYTNLKLSFGVRKQAVGGSAMATLALDYWDGSAYQAVTLTGLPGTSDPQDWYYISNIALPAGACINGLRLRFSKTGTAACRIDDMKLTGDPICTAPTTQASSITFPSVGSTTLNVNWTNGSGAGRVVKMNTSNSFTAPTTGANPTANTAYSGSGEQVVFNGTGSGPITITGLSASTTYWFRVYEYCSPDRVYQTATASNNPNSQATTAGSTSIATTSASYGPFCNGTANGISVAYTPTGSFTGTFYVQLSDASGVFPSNTTSNLIGTGSGSSPISASIPSGTAAGTGYRVRVINNTPVTYGTDNGSNISISATPTTPTCATPAAVCEGTAASITGTGSTGAGTYTYWTLSSGGSQITTGTTPPGTVAANNLTTPTSLAAGSYTYYVQGENGSCLSASRQAVTVTVNAVPANPTGSISVSANPSCGAATLSYTTGYYWQTSASGTSTASPTSSNYSLAATGTIYVRAYNGSCWSAGTINTGSVTVNTAPSIAVPPANQTATTPATASFSVTASGTGITYQWQVSTDNGGSWNNVSTGTGGTSAGYTTAATNTGMNGYQYRCVVTGTAPCTSATSSAATLTVNTGPCLSENFAVNALPTSWDQSSITFTSNYAEFGANTGTLTTLPVSYPSSLAFDLMRTTNTTAKTLYVKVSTTSQTSGFTTVATYDHSNTTSGGTTAGTVDLSAYNSYSTVYIQFEKSSSTTSPWRLDNISLTCATPCTAPSTQASAITFGSVTSTSMNVNWTNGSGAGRVVKMNSSNSFTAPTDGSNPSASTAWANSGEQVIYNGTGSGPVSISGLLSGSTYWFRVYEYCSPTRTYQTATATNNPNSQISSASPEINLKGNSVSIVNGDVTPALADHTDFGSTETSGGSVVRTFTIENTGTAALNLIAGSPYVALSGTNASDFSVTAIPSASIAASSSTTFQITFDPSATGTKTATVTIANNDLDEASYTFSIQGTGTNSATSDILADAGFTYTSNIDYTLYQGNPASTTTNSVGAFKFTVRDGGATANDADALGTELSGITFTVANLGNIRSAALFGGASQNTLISNSPIINTGTGTIAFTGLSGTNVTAADNGSKDLTLRVSFLTAVTDNQQLQYTVSAASANTSGSSFAAADGGAATSSITGDRNRIEVTATQLAFVQQPGNTSINAAMAPSPTVSANDANGNRDLDFTGTVSVTSTGTLSTTPITATAASGLATFSVTHTVAGTSLTLSASASGVTGITSSSFNITSIAYVNGDYRTTGSGNWISNNASPAIWERLVSGVWTSNNSPSYSTSNNVYIQSGHTLTTGGSYGSSVNLIVMDGGTFNNNHTGTVGSAYIYGNGILNINASLSVAGGGNFEVENDGNVNITFEYGTPSSSIWQGTEIFHPASNFTFKDWDCANDNLLPDNTSISTNPYNGYTAAFGNIILDFDSNLGASDDWILLTSGTSINLAHGDLIFRSNDLNGADMRLSTTGTVTSGIGGSFRIEDTYLATQVVNLKTSGTLTFTIKGDLQLEAATTRVFTGTTGGSTITVEGDLNITPSAVLDMCSTVAAGGASAINLKGDLSVAGSGLLQNSNTSNLGQFHFAGTGNGLSAATTQTIDIASTGANENKNMAFTVDNGAYAQLANRDFELGNNSTVTVASGGIFDCGFNGSTALLCKEVSAGASTTVFAVQSGGTLKITSADAGGSIRSSNASGNIQVDTRTFDAGGIYHYIGQANQITGDGLPNNITGKVIVEMTGNNLTLTPSASRTISAGGELNIKKGTVIETNGGPYFDGAGYLSMSDGLYQIATVNTGATELPRLSGTYTLTGGTVELNGITTSATAIQTLRGASREYYNLKISGSSAGGGYKNIPSAMLVKNNLEITGSAIFDIASNGMTGAGGITMANGRLRMSKLSTSLPELTGTATPYALTGGVVEFYGSGSSQSQLIRASYGSPSNPIVYANLEINAAAANIGTYNVSPASGIIVGSTLTVNAPAVFQLDVSEAVSGTGNVTLTTGSTLKYASPNGIKTSGTGTSDGNIRISGTRTFPTTASYGFVGNGNMVSGNGLPATVANLYVQKGNTADEVSLTNSVSATGTLSMTSGNVVTGSNLLELGISTVEKGTLAYTDGYVIGSMKRWFDGTNSGEASGLFPLGVGTNDRFVTVEYGSAPGTGGALTAQFIETAMGTNGLPLSIAAVGSCIPFTAENTSADGYWQMDNSAITGGNYDITLVGQNLSGITDLCQLTGLKRVSGGPWLQSGTHVEPTGSITRPVVKRTGATGWSNWGFGGGTVNPLPVELTSFTGTCDANTVALRWTTASELNSERFIVEKSTDLQTFEYVTALPAAGNSNEIRTYQTEVPRAEALAYFRLRQEDFDGAFEYFGPISVSCANTHSWNVYTHGSLLFVSGEDVEPGTYTLRVLDMGGKQLHTQTISTDGTINATADVSGLAPGMYLVAWQGAKDVKTWKIIISQ